MHLWAHRRLSESQRIGSTWRNVPCKYHEVTQAMRYCTLAPMAVLKRPGSLRWCNSLFFNNDVDGKP